MKRLLLLLFSTFALAGAPENPNQQQPSEQTMNRLVKLYGDFGLPFPPPDAPLIRVPTGWNRSIKEGKSEPIYTLGFLLKPADDKQPAEILVGPCKSTFAPTKGDDEIERIKPEDVRVSELSFDWKTEFSLNVGPALAIQCFQRSHTELAEKLMAASPGAVRGSGPVAVSTGGPWMRHRQSPAYTGRPGDPAEVLLGGTAWSFWLNELMKSESDWKTIRERMAKVVAEIPSLNDTPRKALLESLDAALQPTNAPAGSIEAAIDALVNCSNNFSTTPRNKKPHPTYEKLLLLGFEAVPALIEHLEDKRLTRSLMVGFNNFPTAPRRISELVSDLLGDLMGEPDKGDWLPRQLGSPLAKERVKKWWSGAEKIGEENYVRKHVLPRTGETRFPQPTHLRIIETRYPKHLPSIYREMLDSKAKSNGICA